MPLRSDEFSGSPFGKFFGPEFSSPPLWSVLGAAEFLQNHSGTKQILEALQETRNKQIHSLQSGPPQLQLGLEP